MNSLQRILCPVDFSEASRRALQRALAIAGWYESELSVLHVEDPLLYAASIEASGDAELWQRHYRELHSFISAAGGVPQQVHVRIGNGTPVSGILHEAARDRSDLIVMGSRGRSGLTRAVLGSVTERVVRESPVPVLTIPLFDRQDSAPFVPFNPILVASDFSPACRNALELSITMGQDADARLILLHALPPSAVDVGFTPLTAPPVDRAEARRRALARLRCGLPGDAMFRCRPEVVVREGPPAEAIVEAADREDVKLIVMGVQSRSAFDRLLFGSTTRDVVQAAGCPVLSVRAGAADESWSGWPAAA